MWVIARKYAFNVIGEFISNNIRVNATVNLITFTFNFKLRSPTLPEISIIFTARCYTSAY